MQCDLRIGSVRFLPPPAEGVRAPRHAGTPGERAEPYPTAEFARLPDGHRCFRATTIKGYARTILDMETKDPLYPNLCPICGCDSIAAFFRPGAIDLYRCSQGHWFFYDSLVHQNAANGRNELNELLASYTSKEWKAPRFRRAQRRGNLLVFPKAI